MKTYNEMTKKELLIEVAKRDADFATAATTAKATKAELIQWLEDNPAKRGMAETLLQYRTGYVPSIAYSGRKSLNNGDAIAQFLAGAEPAQVAILVEGILGLESGMLTAKYASLNPGQVRMNCGNRLRAAIKRGDIAETDLH
jgi:hypothetical protein